MLRKRRRILILDANPYAIEKLHSLFVSEGYNVTMCRGVTEAVCEVKNTRFDCVIVDVQLREMAGYKAVPILKAIDPKLPVIMTAARNTKELEARVRKEEIFYYYIKSFDIEELKLVVRSAKRDVGERKQTRRKSQTKGALGELEFEEFKNMMVATQLEKDKFPFTKGGITNETF